MKLYYSPGSCALGIHVLLEEIGAPFELKRLNFPEREQYGESFVSINPKSKVPTLERDDGSVLTEYQAISTYLALTHLEKGLIPADIERQIRMMEAMDYVVGTIHGQGFRLVFRPMDYAPHEADQDVIKARGMEKANRGLAPSRLACGGLGLDLRRESGDFFLKQGALVEGSPQTQPRPSRASVRHAEEQPPCP
jgi:glutathione S-transferase